MEDVDGHTMDHDGLLLHAELTIGNSRIMIADTKPDWPYTPGLLQVYVEDLEATLAKAEDLGGSIVTRPTDFFGDLFSRMKDPFGNLWWIYQHNPASTPDWSQAGASSDEAVDESADKAEYHWEPSKEMTYIHDTLITAMNNLR